MVKSEVTRERHIIVVDGDSANGQLLTSVLNWENSKVHLLPTLEAGVSLLDSVEPDLIIIDIGVQDALQALQKIKEKHRYVSVIFISSSKKVEDIVKGLNVGADDYICKPFHPSELLARVNSHLRIHDLHRELLAANNNLAKLVATDDLTGLYNMRSLYEKLEVEIERARRFKRALAVIMLDLDFFKTVNDKHDHLFGSYVLSQVGQMIRENMRQLDFAARYGGDEFLLVLTDTNIVGAQVFCERLRERIAATNFKSGKQQMKITASLGFAIYDGTGAILEGKDLVRAADRALYKSKNSGRNCVTFYAIDEDSHTPAHQKAAKKS